MKMGGVGSQGKRRFDTVGFTGTQSESSFRNAIAAEWKATASA
jgi:hypothetical protein